MLRHINTPSQSVAGALAVLALLTVAAPSIALAEDL